MAESGTDLFWKIRQARTPEEYCSAMESGIGSLGFDFFAFGIRLPFPLTAPEFRIVSNYPAAWQRRYRESHYVSIDPTVRRGLRSLSPVVWSDVSAEGPAQFWAEAREHGLVHGWAQASRGIGGTIGMLSLARSAEPITAAEISEKLAMLTLMSVLGHEPLARTTLVSERRQDPLDNARVLTVTPGNLAPRLTNREVEVLRWTAEGKVSLDIAEILGIAERTVNFHVDNCMKKIGATSKSSAVAQAALWGLL